MIGYSRRQRTRLRRMIKSTKRKNDRGKNYSKYQVSPKDIIEELSLESFVNLNAVNTPIKCQSCSKTFDSHLDLGLHSKEHNVNSVYSCHMCNYKNKFLRHFHKHIDSHNQYKCLKCNRVFKFKLAALKHSKSHPTEFIECEVCGKQLKRGSFKNHQKKMHSEKPQESIFKCTLCNKSYLCRTSLRNHYSYNHRELGIDVSVVCDVCGKRLSCKNKFLQHQRTHTGERPFECSVCSKRFTTKEILLSHTRVHTGEKPFECKYCGKKFAHDGPFRSKKKRVKREPREKKEKKEKDKKEKKPKEEKVKRPKKEPRDSDDEDAPKRKRGRPRGEPKEKPMKRKKQSLLDAELQKFVNINQVSDPLICQHCDSSFMSHEDFGIHSKKHSADEMFHCHLCEFKHEATDKFRAHVRTHDLYKCEKCSRILKTKLSAYKHAKTHSVQELVQCEICGKNLKKQCLYMHKRVLHTKERLLTAKCPICEKEYVNASSLRQHYSAVHREMGVDISVVCDICGMRLSCKGKLAQHMRTHTGDKPFACTFCPKKFIAKDILAAHMRVHTGEKPYECRFCGKRFAHSAPYRYHVKTHTGEKTFACPLCGKGFISRANMKIHLRTCNNVVVIKPKQKKVRQRRTTKTQKLKENKVKKAKKEKIQKDDDPEFEINNVKNDASDDEDYLPLTTVKSKIKRTRKTQVKDPESKERRGRKPKHREEEYLKTFDNLNVPVKPLVCNECTKIFETHLDFAMHSKIHATDDFYYCHLCEYKNEDKTLFRNHMITHDVYKCKECNKIFDNKRSTFKHSKIHTSQSFVPCEICGKCVRSVYLETHKKAVHAEGGLPSNFSCTLCDKTYKNSTALKSHYSYNHREVGIDMSVICDICGMRLSCKAKLKQHMRIHTGDRPFPCPECPKKFISKDVLTSHLRVHTGEKPYVCMYCSKRFAHGAPYRYHIKTHTGEKSFKCPICEKGFISKANMRIHLKSCMFPVK